MSDSRAGAMSDSRVGAMSDSRVGAMSDSRAGAMSDSRVGAMSEPDPRDARAVGLQLGRTPRAMTGVAHRCPCELPDVVETKPRLDDGTPFPTLYYLTCPRLASAIGTLEADGLMKEQTARLAEDPELRERYEAAARDYVARRDRLEVLQGVPAQGGMPVRVKCLHVLVAHSLAVGPGVNPFGDEALERLPDWWAKGPCVDPDDPDAVPGKRTRS